MPTNRFEIFYNMQNRTRIKNRFKGINFNFFSAILFLSQIKLLSTGVTLPIFLPFFNFNWSQCAIYKRYLKTNDCFILVRLWRIKKTIQQIEEKFFYIFYRGLKKVSKITPCRGYFANQLVNHPKCVKKYIRPIKNVLKKSKSIFKK